MTPLVAASIGTLALGLGVLLWLIFAGPDEVRSRSLQNLSRGAAASMTSAGQNSCRFAQRFADM